MGTDQIGVRLKTLADRLRVALALLDLDGKGLAEALSKAGLTTDPNTVSAWLLGQVSKPAPEKMAKIAEWLGVTPATLATGAGFLSIGESAGLRVAGEAQGNLVRLSLAETEAIARDLSLLASRLYAATQPASTGSPTPTAADLPPPPPESPEGGTDAQAVRAARRAAPAGRPRRKGSG